MSWITPPTFADGNTVKTTDLNATLYSDMNYLFHYVKRKAADLTVSTNTTDADLNLQPVQFTIGEIWTYEFFLRYTATAGSSGIQFQVYGGPSAYPGMMSAIGPGATITQYAIGVNDSITTGVAPLFGASATTERVVIIRGICLPNVTTATLGLNVSPQTGGNNVTLKAGSWLLVERVKEAA